MEKPGENDTQDGSSLWGALREDDGNSLMGTGPFAPPEAFFDELMHGGAAAHGAEQVLQEAGAVVDGYGDVSDMMRVLADHVRALGVPLPAAEHEEEEVPLLEALAIPVHLLPPAGTPMNALVMAALAATPSPPGEPRGGIPNAPPSFPGSPNTPPGIPNAPPSFPGSPMDFPNTPPAAVLANALERAAVQVPAAFLFPGTVTTPSEEAYNALLARLHAHVQLGPLAGAPAAPEVAAVWSALYAWRLRDLPRDEAVRALRDLFMAAADAPWGRILPSRVEAADGASVLVRDVLPGLAQVPVIHTGKAEGRVFPRYWLGGMGTFVDERLAPRAPDWWDRLVLRVMQTPARRLALLARAAPLHTHSVFACSFLRTVCAADRWMRDKETTGELVTLVLHLLQTEARRVEAAEKQRRAAKGRARHAPEQKRLYASFLALFWPWFEALTAEEAADPSEAGALATLAELVARLIAADMAVVDGADEHSTARSATTDSWRQLLIVVFRHPKLGSDETKKKKKAPGEDAAKRAADLRAAQEAQHAALMTALATVCRATPTEAPVCEAVVPGQRQAKRAKVDPVDQFEPGCAPADLALRPVIVAGFVQREHTAHVLQHYATRPAFARHAARFFDDASLGPNSARRKLLIGHLFARGLGLESVEAVSRGTGENGQDVVYYRAAHYSIRQLLGRVIDAWTPEERLLVAVDLLTGHLGRSDQPVSHAASADARDRLDALAPGTYAMLAEYALPGGRTLPLRL